MSTASVKHPPQEETRLTINPEIVSYLIDIWLQGVHRIYDFQKVFPDYETNKDFNSFPEVMMKLFGMEEPNPDQKELYSFYLSVYEDRVLTYPGTVTPKESNQENDSYVYSKEDSGNFYNMMIKARATYDGIGEVIQENNQQVNETERKPYTINESIVKQLIAKHLENSRINSALEDLFESHNHHNPNELFINWTIAAIFGLKNDRVDASMFEKFIYSIKTNVKPLDNPTSHERNELESYPKKVIDSIYNELINIQKEYKSERIKS